MIVGQLGWDDGASLTSDHETTEVIRTRTRAGQRCKDAVGEDGVKIAV